MPKIRFTADLRPDLYEWLEEYCEREEISRNEGLERAVERLWDAWAGYSVDCDGSIMQISLDGLTDTTMDAAHVVDEEGHVLAAVVEPLERQESDEGWDETAFRKEVEDIVRTEFSAMEYPVLVVQFDPGRDQCEEVAIYGMIARCAECDGLFFITRGGELPVGHEWAGPDWDDVELDEDGTATVLHHEEGQ
jgi:hypothetical protein